MLYIDVRSLTLGSPLLFDNVFFFFQNKLKGKGIFSQAWETLKLYCTKKNSH